VANVEARPVALPLRLIHGVRPFAGTIVGALIFIIGVWTLHRLASEISWHAVKDDIAGLPWSTLAASIGFTAVSYLAFSFYDVLALHSAAPGRVPLRIAVMAGSAGYAISNLLGFSYLTGAAVRTRIYAGYRLDLALIASVIANIWVFFWLGIILLFAVMLIVQPANLIAIKTISPGLESAIGYALLGALTAFLFWLSRRRRVIAFRSFHVPLPGFRLAVAQIAVGMLDVMGSALALYVLLPVDVAQNFPLMFVVYVAAIALGIASHAPGGIGVFEATIIAGLGAAGRSDVLASLVLYRVIYYVLPFAIAATGIAIAWGATNRRKAGSVGQRTHAAIRPLVPGFSAGLALLTGIILLLSGNLPAETGRMKALESILPLSLVEVSHLLGSVFGLLLIVTAHGLYRKQFRAWLFTVGLLAAGIVVSLSKGFDWEEATALALALGVLVLFRSAFYRAAGQSIFILSTRWILVSVAVFGLAVWVGAFSYSHVEYNNDLWWRFAWNGDAPRYLRASLVAGIALMAVGLHSIINASGRRMPPEPVPDAVRRIVAASTNAEANIHLTGDKRFLVSPEESAFIGYADTGSSLIAKGDPIGDHDAGVKLIWQLRETADRLGKQCAYYAVWEEYLPAYLDMGCSILKIGEIARVALPDFTLDGSGKKDFRYARSKARREGYVFGIVARGLLEPVLPELEAISDAWLAIKKGEEKGFALGRFDGDYLSNFDHAVIRHGSTGKIIAFANLFQSAGKHELSVDLMRYDPEAPSFAMDALFGELLMWGKEQGFKWFSLGAAPFAGMQAHPLATIWSRIGSYVYEHGEHFYHFEGLRSFKQKFDPVWSPNYLAISRGMAAPRVLYEVNGLISGGVQGLLK
jgi:phosphatidylglycerol lysyltransferase